MATKNIIFIDNDREERSAEDLDTILNTIEAFSDCEFDTSCELDESKITTVSNFYHKSREESVDLIFKNENIIFTYSMFTSTHFNSFGQLRNLLVGVGRNEIKQIDYIDFASDNLLKAVERIISNDGEKYNWEILNAIENNRLIYLDYAHNCFKRIRVQFDLYKPVYGEQINLKTIFEKNQLLKV